MLSEYTACAKTILLGEHFVVHGAPAVAAPLHGLQTTVQIYEVGSLSSPEMQSDYDGETRVDSKELLGAALACFGLSLDCSWRFEVSSSIPVGLGLGSSAALSVALCGAIARASGRSVDSAELSRHAFALESLVHGAPSGVDNNVVAYGRPILFAKEAPMQCLLVGGSLELVLASSGSAGSTRDAVAAVSALRTEKPEWFLDLCTQSAELTQQARVAIESGNAEGLGALFSSNQMLLREIGVSNSILERLIESANAAGAYGAKLTGAGMGGCVVAVVAVDLVSTVVHAFEVAGSPWVQHCRLEGH